MRAVLLSLIILLLPCAAIAGEFQGQVIAVIDGDTVDVLHNQRPVRVRLHGIDCPEKAQAFGERAKQATSQLVFGKDVAVRRRGTDRNGRTVGEVLLLPDRTNVNHTLVLNGWCWWYQKYAPRDLALQQAEQVARETKKGLWANAHAVAPWVYRRLHANPGR